jgi:hypothetical protein
MNYEREDRRILNNLEFFEANVTQKEKIIRLENLTLGLMKAYSC